MRHQTTMTAGEGEGGLVEGLEAVQIEYVEELAGFYRQAFRKLVHWTVALGATSALVRFCGGSLWTTPAGFGLFTGGMAVAAKAGADRAAFQARRVRRAAEVADARKLPVHWPPPGEERVH